MPGHLTTHVLDIAQGRPSAGMRVELWHLDATGGRELLAAVRANTDGRTDAPLLAEGALRVGVYELIFGVGEYFRAQRVATATPPFLDQVPVRFSIADPEADYHVPLLVSPWAYSTYRGS